MNTKELLMEKKACYSEVEKKEKLIRSTTKEEKKWASPIRKNKRNHSNRLAEKN